MAHVEGGDKDARREVRGLVTLGIAVLSFVSLVLSRKPEMMSGHGASLSNEAVGAVGAALAGFLRALVGSLAAWLLPLLIFLSGLHSLMRSEQLRMTRRGWGCTLLYIDILGLLHMSNPNYLLPFQSHPDLWRTLGVAVGGHGGGLIGAAVAVVLASLFGITGSYIVLGVLVVVSAFLIVDVHVSDVLCAIGGGLAGGFRALRAWLSSGWVRDEDDRDGGDDESLSKPPSDKTRAPFGVLDLRRSMDRLRARGLSEDGLSDDEHAEDPGGGVAYALEAPDVNDAYEDVSEPIVAPHPPYRPRAAEPTRDVPGGTDGAAVQDEGPPRRSSSQREGARPTLTSAGTVNPFYQLPPLDLLTKPPAKPAAKKVVDQSTELVQALVDFGVDASVVGMDRGPHVTRYDVRLAPGVKYTRVSNLEEDIALALQAYGVRISPIHGTGKIGIEVANKEVSTVYLRDVLEAEAFQKGTGRLTIGLGKDTAGAPAVVDLAKMVHTLISGATGSGKSVCINTLITSLLYKARPEEVRLLMIDPKVVELSVYNDIPHLLAPVITDPRQAASSLKWVVVEMERRYKLFARAAVRHLDSFNQMWQSKEEIRAMATDIGYGDVPIPYIVVIVDELADLMMVASDDVEDAICRLAQKARAAGIHLVLATQRPSTDVITGLIKANIPSRVAFAVASSVDSRVILDCNGAERLLGKGDMLCLPMGANRPIRVQGAFISDSEVERVVEFVRNQAEPEYRDDIFEAEVGSSKQKADAPDEDDELLKDAVRIVLETQHASASMLQRKLSVGYARAARLIDVMEKKGMVGPHQGSKPREILINSQHLEELSG